MSQSLLAIGLDGADSERIQQWCAAGELPTLAKFIQSSRYVELENYDAYRAEIPWTTFLTGVPPEQTGYWGRIQYDASRCQANEHGAYDFNEYPPFYALAENKKVCVFDMPQTRLQDQIDGIQMLAWGAHSPRGPSVSKPSSLFNQLQQQYGAHPRLNNDHANIYDSHATQQLRDDFLTGISRRTDIALDLLQRDNWDLFLMMYSESHSAGHTFWHLDQAHPLHGKLGRDQDNFQLDIFRAIDESLAKILCARPFDNVVIFSVHGMIHNVLDVSSMLVLPELLYCMYVDRRGKLCVDGGSNKHSTDFPQHWAEELWQRRKKCSMEIDSPEQQRRAQHSLAWQAANWYTPMWPTMNAFALPSYSDGYVRLNVQGRDQFGRVHPNKYHQTCEEIIADLKQLKSAESDVAAIRAVIKTRQNPLDDNPKLPDADLIVLWNEEFATNHYFHPTWGNFGPVPYFRTGGHRNLGFAAINGTDIPAGQLATQPTLSLTSSLLSLMNVTPPNYMAEASLI